MSATKGGLAKKLGGQRVKEALAYLDNEVRRAIKEMSM